MMGLKQIVYKKIFFLNAILICIISLNACAKVGKNEDVTQKAEQTLEQISLHEIESESIESEDISSTQVQWQVYIAPGMPHFP